MVGTPPVWIPRFYGPLDTRDLNQEVPEGRVKLKLLAPLVYDSAVLERRVVVPQDFVTDLASIPRPLWVAIPPSGRYNRAAVIHDWLYQSGVCTRMQADNAFSVAMAEDRVRSTLRYVIWSGVVVGGWVTWARYRREEAIEVAAKSGVVDSWFVVNK